MELGKELTTDQPYRRGLCAPVVHLLNWSDAGVDFRCKE